MGWLGENKDAVETSLFQTTRDLFTELSLVFFDTTSIYFEGEGGATLGQRGHSKDHRPDRKQMIVGAALDGAGRPVSCKMWPGNHTDVKALIPPGVYFRMLLIGYFERIDSERGIAWRCADSLSLRDFLGIALDEATPTPRPLTSRSLRPLIVF